MIVKRSSRNPDKILFPVQIWVIAPIDLCGCQTKEVQLCQRIESQKSYSVRIGNKEYSVNGSTLIGLISDACQGEAGRVWVYADSSKKTGSVGLIYYRK